MKYLLCFLYLVADMCCPGEMSRDVHTKKLEPVYPPHLVSLNAEGMLLCAPGFSVVYYQLLDFRRVQVQIESASSQ